MMTVQETPIEAVAPPAYSRLKGRVAFITGAARGIGRAIAVKYAREGADIVAYDIAAPVQGTRDLVPATPDDLLETERLVHATGQRSIAIQGDVRDYEAVQQAMQRTMEEFGKLDIVVANASVAIWSPLAQMTPEDWQIVQDVNLTGVFNTIRASLDHMIERKQGRIIALTSIGGRQGVAGVANYAATKWGTIGLIKSAAIELGPYNVTVNAIAPCAVNTPLYRSKGQEHSTGVDSSAAQDAQTRQYNALPIAALEPTDIADSAVFLASDEARYVSGMVLDVAAGGNARYTG